MERGRLPLAGIRVADFTTWAAGPLVGKMLADHGAEVIKVESESFPDGLRLAAPKPLGNDSLNVGGWFNNLNSSKLSIALNMNHPKARDIALRLIQVCDVVIDNFAPRVMERWGLTYAELVKIKPDIIVVNEPMQGLDGPHRDYLGFGSTIQAVAGINYLTGFRHRPPVGIGLNYPDYSANPYHTTIAVLAALRYRHKTGKGQHIEVSQVESTASVLETAILDYTANGRVQSRVGNRLPHAAPHGAYRCRGEDRWCAIAVFNDEEWHAFCRVIGNPSWTKEERFATLLARKENEDELDRLVEEWTKERTPEEVMELMQRDGVAAGVVQNAEDMLVRDPQLRAREHYVYLDHSEAGRTAYDGVPFKLSATPSRPRSAAPLLGEHNDYVYKELLGMSEEEINEYLVEGVIA